MRKFVLFLSVAVLFVTDIPALEAELNKIGAPRTPGRLPVWKE